MEKEAEADDFTEKREEHNECNGIQCNGIECNWRKNGVDWGQLGFR